MFDTSVFLIAPLRFCFLFTMHKNSIFLEGTPETDTYSQLDVVISQTYTPGSLDSRLSLLAQLPDGTFHFPRYVMWAFTHLQALHPGS